MNIDELVKENNILKHRLNDIVFDDANADVELGARYLRKIGYIGFDEERKVYVNLHNEEPFWQEDEREKNYYIKDEELCEYTKQLESKVKKLEKSEETINSIKKYNEMATKEIERLKKENENLEKLNNANYQSFIETNNIINELEKWLIKQQIEEGEYCDFLLENKQIKVEEVLDKIKELKGSDKE